ncbi:hypothetical protein [Actinocorallia populi]|uniref:hypothetical protein n=1 Tax=Actinocorallia populi TaxID=2079200 RepID=UPI000D0906BB|nr:hypothetical protein [Actinocorallia populi]
MPVFEPASSLLERLSLLPYPLRMRELALHARNAGARLDGLLAELAELGPYGRRTALHMAIAGRRFDHLAAVLAGADPELRRAALRAVRTLPVPDEAVPPVLEDAPTELRYAVYRTLVAGRREALAERLLPQVHARWGPQEAAALLPACGSGVVREWLPRVGHAVTRRRVLARRHPGAVLDLLERECRDGLGPQVYGRWTRTFAELSRAEPVRMLELIEASFRNRVLYMGGKVLGPLFRADFTRTTGLISRRCVRSGLPSPMFRQASRLSGEQLTRYVSWRTIKRFLRSVPFEQRASLYAQVEMPMSEVLDLLELLPDELSVSEARRLRELHASDITHRDHPVVELRIIAHLPFGEAAPRLREAAFTGDPRLRGAARVLLLKCAARTRDSELVEELLGEVVERTANEQDPVRATLLKGLAGVRMDGSCVPHLERLAEAVVRARDTSEDTRETLRQLAGRLFPSSDPALAGWALRVYEKLVARHGAAALRRPQAVPVRYGFSRHRTPALGTELRRGQERELLALLLPYLRNDHALVIELARSLGARSRRLPELQDALRRAVLTAPDDEAAQAAELWLTRAPDKAERVASLDASALRHPAVWRVVASRRTDLLDQAPLGLVTPDMPGKWNVSQRDRIEEALLIRAQDAGLAIGERLVAVSGLRAFPDALAALLQTIEDEPVILEAALEGLGRRPRSVEELLTRGPVAQAAASRACRFAVPSLLSPVLEEALTGGKVGARKAAARQFVTQRIPGAVEPLLRAWNDPETHPDVRIAVAVALRRVPEDPRALAALRSRLSGEEMARSFLQMSPLDFAPEHRPDVAELVHGLLRAAGGPGVRARAARAFGIWAHWYRPGTAEFLEAAVTGDETDLSVFLLLLRHGIVRGEALDVMRRLLATEEPPGSRVTSLAEAIRYGARAPWRDDLARAFAGLLACEPLRLPLATALLESLLPTENVDPQAMAGELTSLAGLLDGRPVLAAQTAQKIEDRYRHTRLSSSAFLPAIRDLTAQGALPGALFAVSLTALAGDSTGWPTEFREALLRLRASPHLEARQAAHDVELPDGP